MGFLSNKIWVRIFLGHPVNPCLYSNMKWSETLRKTQKNNNLLQNKTILNTKIYGPGFIFSHSCVFKFERLLFKHLQNTSAVTMKLSRTQYQYARLKYIASSNSASTYQEKNIAATILMLCNSTKKFYSTFWLSFTTLRGCISFLHLCFHKKMSSNVLRFPLTKAPLGPISEK